MPWLTPDNIPEADDCRPLFIPADSTWLALVSGALTELTLPYNWEKFGSLTVAETVAKMQEIIDGYYGTACLACTFPDGGAVIRIDSTGHIQQLGDGGVWQDPTGDYVIPAPAARVGGTSEDQICLASENAVNVLHELYNSLSDSFASHLTEAEAEAAFIAALIALVGFEFAPITTAIAIFFFGVFELLYRALSYLTADLWSDALTNQLVCFLVQCATNTAGVVTFDWDCFIGKLNSLTDSFGLTEIELRFYLQVSYILYFIGGVDGLNLAARTTAITTGNCDVCLPWCYRFDAADRLGDWHAELYGTTGLATWDGTKWNGATNSGTNVIWISWTLGTPIILTDASIQTYTPAGSGRAIYVNGNGSSFTGTVIWQNGAAVGAPFPITVTRIDVYLLNAGSSTLRTLSQMQFSGQGGGNPFGDDNC